MSLSLDNSWTPIGLQVAEHGDEGALKLLLEQYNINPNAADTKYGRSPPPWAVEKGHERVVKLLLQRDDIDPNTADTEYGQTPLERAAL